MMEVVLNNGFLSTATFEAIAGVTYTYCMG